MDMRVSIFFTRGRGIAPSVIRFFQSTLKEKLTGRLFPYNHCGLIFHFSEVYPLTFPYDECNLNWMFDKGGYYFESRCTKIKDPKYGRVGKNGVRGPMGIAKLYEWANAHPKHHLTIIGLPIEDRSYIAAMLRDCFRARETIGYADMGQMLSHALRWWRQGSTRTKWHCGEMCARVLCGYKDESWRKLLRVGDALYDWVTPRVLFDTVGECWKPPREHLDRVLADTAAPDKTASQP